MTTPCWIWPHVDRGTGYAYVYVDRGRMLMHRLMFEIVHGPIPEGYTVDHTCHNGTGCSGGRACPHRACFNPAHLEAIPLAENVMRGESPHAANARKTHCKRGHPFDEVNTHVTKSGSRVCRTCNRERVAARAQT